MAESTERLRLELKDLSRHNDEGLLGDIPGSTLMPRRAVWGEGCSIGLMSIRAEWSTAGRFVRRLRGTDGSFLPGPAAL